VNVGVGGTGVKVLVGVAVTVGVAVNVGVLLTGVAVGVATPPAPASLVNEKI
jgi:hypothetical protein